MAGPWENYAHSAPTSTEGGPWAKYAAPTQAPADAAPISAGDRVNAVATGFNSGIAGLLGIPMDTAANIVDLMKAAAGSAYMKATGKAAPAALEVNSDRSGIPGTSAYIKGLMGSAAELPHPEDQVQQYLNVGGQGASAALVGPAGGSRILPSVVSGVTAAEAQKVAADSGAGPVGQAVAGLAGGLAPGAAASTAGLAKNAVAGVVRPLTRSGQQAIASRVLQDQAINPQTAAARLDANQPTVAGSQPTTGAASGDIGVLALEKAVRSQNPAEFGTRTSEQNAARQAALDKIAGTPQDIEAAKISRDVVTGPMRDAALSGPAANPAGFSNVTSLTPVKAKIDAILASPQGQRQTIKQSIEWARDQIGDNADPAALYEIRKDLQLAQRGKLQPSSQNAPAASTLAQARGQLGDVVSALDDQIEASAPGFKAYLQRYKDLSKPIDQMKVIQEIQNRAQTTAVDPNTQRQFLSPALFRRALDNATQKSGATLSPSQVQTLRAIRTDLDMGAAITGPTVKAPGSDTFQNLSVASAIGAGKLSTHPAIQALTRPLNWLYKSSDKQINEIIADAMLNPKLASLMLKQATPQTMRQWAGITRARMERGTLAAAATSAATQQTSQSSSGNQ